MIRFKCPHCKKALRVEDSMGGRKAACPACKKAITIPALVAPPADVEAFAAATLSDPAPAAAAPRQPATQFIDFNCFYCDSEQHVPADLAGKQNPCSECGRILKVPLPKEDKPKDWRTMAKVGPSAAIQNLPEKLAGAWGTEEKERVSSAVLAEVGALPEVELEPVGLVGWLKRGFWTVLVVGLVALAVVGFTRQREKERLKASIDHALAYLGPESKLLPLWKAEIHRGAGELYTRALKPTKAREQFLAARGLVAQAADAQANPDADALLIQLALNQVELGGSAQQVLDKERLDWKDPVHKDLFNTLKEIRIAEARLDGMRRAASRLVARGQDVLAIGLAGQLQAEGKSDSRGGRSPMLAEQVALLVARDENAKAQKLVPLAKPAEEIEELAPRLAYAEGRARNKDWPGALALVKAKGPASHRLLAGLAVASLALDEEKYSTDEAAPFLHESQAALEELSGQASPWLILSLIKYRARTQGLEDAKQQLPLLNPHPPFKARAQLELFYVQLAKASGEIDYTQVNEVGEPGSLVRALAWEAWARHQARLGYGHEVLQHAEKMTGAEEAFRPFLHVGAALGEKSGGD